MSQSIKYVDLDKIDNLNSDTIWNLKREIKNIFADFSDLTWDSSDVIFELYDSDKDFVIDALPFDRLPNNSNWKNLADYEFERLTMFDPDPYSHGYPISFKDKQGNNCIGSVTWSRI